MAASPASRPSRSSCRGQWSNPYQQDLAGSACRPRTLAHCRVAPQVCARTERHRIGLARPQGPSSRPPNLHRHRRPRLRHPPAVGKLNAERMPLPLGQPRISAQLNPMRFGSNKNCFRLVAIVLSRDLPARMNLQVQAANKSEPDLDEYLRTHVCLMPFRSVETTNRGLAHVCCPDWLPTPFGKLDANLLDQWSGPMAKKIRASVLDGSYNYCSRLHCG
jgi:hypothetical protein